MDKKTDGNDLSQLIDQDYVPSGKERRRAVMMYFFVGMLMMFVKKNNSFYEKYHFAQALGWWMIFFIFLVLSFPLVLLPYLKVISIFGFIGLLVFWGVFIKQAWNGEYYLVKSQKIKFPLFKGIGMWILELFEIQEES